MSRTAVARARSNKARAAAEVDDVRSAVRSLKRERIVAAAVTQFEQHGFTGASLDAVAEQMGVTKPFIYTQFRSKSHLLGEICSRAIKISLQAIDEALANHRAPRLQLEHFARGLMQGVLRSGKHLAIYMREEKNLAAEDLLLIRDLRREVDRKLVGVLTRGQALGEFDIAEPKLAALAIGGIATWVGVRLGRSEQQSSEHLAEQVVPLILALTGARGSPRPTGGGEPLSAKRP